MSNPRAYLIVLHTDPTVDKIVTGTTYESLPRHCSLVPWFYLNTKHAAICEQLKHMLIGTKPIELHAKKYALFGHDNNIPVHTIEKTQSLMALHMAICNMLEAKFGDMCFHDEGFAKCNYNPHVTLKDGQSIPLGETYISTLLYLVEALVPFALERKIIQWQFTFR